MSCSSLARFSVRPPSLSASCPNIYTRILMIHSALFTASVPCVHTLVDIQAFICRASQMEKLTTTPPSVFAIPLACGLSPPRVACFDTVHFVKVSSIMTSEGAHARPIALACRIAFVWFPQLVHHHCDRWGVSLTKWTVIWGIRRWFRDASRN